MRVQLLEFDFFQFRTPPDAPRHRLLQLLPFRSHLILMPQLPKQRCLHFTQLLQLYLYSTIGFYLLGQWSYHGLIDVWQLLSWSISCDCSYTRAMASLTHDPTCILPPSAVVPAVSSVMGTNNQFIERICSIKSLILKSIPSTHLENLQILNPKAKLRKVI